jgi:hypothetical protein
MMARVGLVLGAAFISFGYVKCTFLGTTGTDTGTGTGTTGSSFSTTLTLQNSSGGASTSFTMGQAIQFNLNVLNQSSQADTLQFSDAQIYDFYVIDANDNQVRWQWSQGMSFAQVTTTLSFAANSSKSYSVLWNGVLADGTQLPAGSYRARGVIVADDFTGDPLMTSDLGSNVVSFTVY